jgi:hypothetical protein
METQRRPDLFVLVMSFLAAGCVSGPLTPDGGRGARGDDAVVVDACAPTPCPGGSGGWDPVTCRCAPPPATDAAAAPRECRGPGRYEAGKEGSYRPCCDGLVEVPYPSAAHGAGNVRICWMPPLNVYACVKGRCGDGICEVGESAPCGCVADCPGARWETPDGG